MHQCEHCGHSCLHNVPIFKHLSPSQQEIILKTALTKEFKKGELLFSSYERSHNLWVLNSGKVKLSRISSDGKEQILRILQKGDFIGDLSLFSEGPMNSDAFALSDCEICIVSGERLKQVIKENPEIAISFLAVYSKRIEEAEQRIEQIGIFDVEQRMIRGLLQLHEVQHKEEITLPYSKSDWASLIGTTRETLSRKLSKFQQEGLIDLKGQRSIILLNLDKFYDLLSEPL